MRRQIKVVYYGRKVDRKLDKKIEKALRTIGCKRYASGLNRVTEARDICFDYEEKEEKK